MRQARRIGREEIGDAIARSVIEKVYKFLDRLKRARTRAELGETANSLVALKTAREDLAAVITQAVNREVTKMIPEAGIVKAPDLAMMRRKNEAYQRLVEVSAYINETLDRNTVLTRIIETAKNIIHSDACSLILLDDEEPEFMNFNIALGESGDVLKTQRIKAEEGIAGHVVRSGAPLIVNDVRYDDRFSQRFDEATGFITRCILCVPIRIREKNGLKTIGAIEILNRSGDRDLYDDNDRDLLVAFSNLAAVAIENSKCYQHAITDRLTKMYNFGFFQDQIYLEIAKALLEGSQFSLIMMDIDNFKRFNDTYGHPVGNRVLKHIASILRDSARDSDIVTRYGGEEFAAILPGTSKKDAHHFAERFRKRLESACFDDEDGRCHVRVTVSIGVSSFPDDGRTAEDVVARADAAMYIAKTTGKNRVILYQDG